MGFSLTMTESQSWLFIKFIDKQLSRIDKNASRYLSSLKGYAEYFRKCWITSIIPSEKALGNFFPKFMVGKIIFLLKGDNSLIYELSCFKRGLPPPLQHNSNKTFELWKETVLNDCPPVPRHRFARFDDWLGSHHFGTPVENPGIRIISGSSCVEYNRREGGRTNFVREKLRHLRPQIYDHPVWTHGPPPDGMTTLDRIERCNIGLKAYQEILQSDLKPTIPNPTYPVLIKELGFKTRIVTKSPAGNVMLGHIDRDKLFHYVKQIPECYEALNEGLLPIPLRVVDDDHYVYSCDLSRATDTVSHEVLWAMARHLGLSELVFKHAYDGKPWKRGCPMGMPASWSILSLTNYWAAIDAAPKSSFRIKGDDLIGYWTKRQINTYQANIRGLGYIVKTSSSYVSLSRGLFCENPYEVRNGYLVPLEGYFSLKFLSQNLPDQINLFALADRFHNLVNEGVPRKIVSSLQGLFLKKEIQKSWQARIDPYVPRMFGGLGLVPKDPDKYPSTHYQRIARRLVSKPFDHRMSLVTSSFPKDSLGRKAGEATAHCVRNLIYGFDSETRAFLCTDRLSAPLLELQTLYHIYRAPSLPPTLGRYFRAVCALKKKLGKKAPGTVVNYRLTYRRLYELEAGIAPVKSVYDIVRFNHPNKKDRERFLQQMEELKAEVNTRSIALFINRYYQTQSYYPELRPEDQIPPELLGPESPARLNVLRRYI
jgi:hypothetical protein